MLVPTPAQGTQPPGNLHLTWASLLAPGSESLGAGAGPQLPESRGSLVLTQTRTSRFPPAPPHTLGRCFYGEAAGWGPELGGPEFKPQLCHPKPRLPHYNLGWKPCPPATLTASTEQLLTIIISTIINKGG